MKYLKELKNGAVVPDKIPTMFIKNHIIAPVRAFIFNLSLTTGIYLSGQDSSLFEETDIKRS